MTYEPRVALDSFSTDIHADAFDADDWEVGALYPYAVIIVVTAAGIRYAVIDEIDDDIVRIVYTSPVLSFLA